MGSSSHLGSADRVRDFTRTTAPPRRLPMADPADFDFTDRSTNGNRV